MEDLMDKALKLAMEALNAQEVPVGCIFVKNNKVIAEDRNRVNETKNPTRHAEMNCIDKVIKYCEDNNLSVGDYFKNIFVVVTVEPCIMCAAALLNLKVETVIYGCANDRFGGITVLDVSTLVKKPYKVIGNIKSEQAMQLLKEFYMGSNPMTQKLKK